jgi:hypothetical protein
MLCEVDLHGCESGLLNRDKERVMMTEKTHGGRVKEVSWPGCGPWSEVPEFESQLRYFGTVGLTWSELRAF